jgi:hypothetical protein
MTLYQIMGILTFYIYRESSNTRKPVWCSQRADETVWNKIMGLGASGLFHSLPSSWFARHIPSILCTVVHFLLNDAKKEHLPILMGAAPNYYSLNSSVECNFFSRTYVHLSYNYTLIKLLSRQRACHIFHMWISWEASYRESLRKHIE